MRRRYGKCRAAVGQWFTAIQFRPTVDGRNGIGPKAYLLLGGHAAALTGMGMPKMVRFSGFV